MFTQLKSTLLTAAKDVGIAKGYKFLLGFNETKNSFFKGQLINIDEILSKTRQLSYLRDGESIDNIRAGLPDIHYPVLHQHAIMQLKTDEIKKDYCSLDQIELKYASSSMQRNQMIEAQTLLDFSLALFKDIHHSWGSYFGEAHRQWKIEYNVIVITIVCTYNNITGVPHILALFKCGRKSFKGMPIEFSDYLRSGAIGYLNGEKWSFLRLVPYTNTNPNAEFLRNRWITLDANKIFQFTKREDNFYLLQRSKALNHLALAPLLSDEANRTIFQTKYLSM